MTVLEYGHVHSRSSRSQQMGALQLPTPDGSMWSYGDPQAEVDAHGGTMSITVNPFRLKHDSVHMLDDPKHLLVTPQPIPCRRRARGSQPRSRPKLQRQLGRHH